MVTIRVARRPRESFSGRSQYLRARGRPDELRICHVLREAMARPAGLVPARGDVDWRYFAWLTPILGSGCADVPDDPSVHPDAFREAVRNQLRGDMDEEIARLKTALRGQGLPFGYEDPESVVTRAGDFARDLVIDRAQWSEEGLHQESTGAVTLLEGAARMVLLAAVLTEFYAAAKRDNPSPWSRWEFDRAFVDSDYGSVDARDLARLAMFYIDGAKSECCHPEGLGEPLANTIRSWLDSVSAGLRGGLSVPGRPASYIQLTERDLRLATEIAWLYLSFETRIYPGWTALMTGLVLSHSPQAEPVHVARAPTYTNFRQDGPATAIAALMSERQLLRSATEWYRRHSDAVRSQHHPVVEQTEGVGLEPGTEEYDAIHEETEGAAADDGEAPPRMAFYEAVANVLWTQSSQSRRPAQHGAAAPASAFVSSFDLELEMALWSTYLRQEPPGAPSIPGRDGRYFVVIPVHVFADRLDEFSRPCWLRGEVTPAASLDAKAMLRAIRNPTDWRLVSNDELDLRDGPHVVRLSGSPLTFLNLMNGERDRLVRDLKAVSVVVNPETMDVQHAVTVDEYLAFQQSEAELVHQLTRSTTDQTVQRDRSLPRLLVSNVSNDTSDDSTVSPRFWMAFGVPVADSAVRYRLVSHIARRLRPAEPPGGSTAGGVEAVDAHAPAARPPSGPRDYDAMARAAVAGARLQDADEGRETEWAEPAAADVDGDRGLQGVVVNRRIDDHAAHVLYWLGLDLVEASVTDFTADLDHYRRHVEAGGAGSLPTGNLRCGVSDG